MVKFGLKSTIGALKNKATFRKRLIALNRAEAKTPNSATGRKLRSKLIKMLKSSPSKKKSKIKNLSVKRKSML